MTKKHYVQIAAAFKSQLDHPYSDDGERLVLQRVAEDLCIVLKQDNPAFDRDRFMTACGF